MSFRRTHHRPTPVPRWLGLIVAGIAACAAPHSTGSTDDAGASDAGSADAGVTDAASPSDGGTPVADAGHGSVDAGMLVDAGPGPVDAGMLVDAGPIDAGTPCTTRIEYGSAWIHPANHPAQDDLVSGQVTWDGTCTDSGANSYATLSNGWQPYFSGNGACLMALDYSGDCPSRPAACTTQITYGSAWLPPPNHPLQYDVVTGRVFSDGVCHVGSGTSSEGLSNGWTPTFSGNDCRLSFEYTQCGGLYANPVIPTDCPDPGVLFDGSRYVLTCTSGNAANAFPIYTSPDLVHWTPAGHVFPAGQWPSWVRQGGGPDFWAPEIHRVGTSFVVYYAARGTDGRHAIGAATSTSSTGPFVDPGAPLVHDDAVGLIDPSEITVNGTPYVLWKQDGVELSPPKPTPIQIQAMTADGTSLVGSAVTLITDDQPWESGNVEAPWMVAQGGAFYLFYSGNWFNTKSYAVGVAKAASPLGPFTKASRPILGSAGSWAGPGHCSVVETPAGDTYMVYHAWVAGAVNAAPGREVLTDLLEWGSDWPAVPFAPSAASRPLP